MIFEFITIEIVWNGKEKKSTDQVRVGVDGLVVQSRETGNGYPGGARGWPVDELMA
jgi:hypothetical protein